jgi:hypothetical protein
MTLANFVVITVSVVIAIVMIAGRIPPPMRARAASWLLDRRKIVAYVAGGILLAVLLWHVGAKCYAYLQSAEMSITMESVWAGTKANSLGMIVALGALFGIALFLPSTWAKLVRGTAGLILLVLAAIAVILWWNTDSPKMSAQAAVPLASSSQALWPKLAIPPRAKSELVPVPTGMHIVMAGYQFRNHTVYADGTDCAYHGTCPEKIDWVLQFKRRAAKPRGVLLFMSIYLGTKTLLV